MTRIEVTRNRSGAGCGWILSVPLLLIGTLLCGGMIFFASMASEASSRGEFQTDTYSVARGDIETAQLEIAMEAGELHVNGLNDSANLFEADLAWRDELTTERIDSNGYVYRIAHESRRDDPMQQLFRFINVGTNWEEEPIVWTVDLSSDVAFTLDIHNSAGLVDLDLRTVTLETLNARVSAGELRLMLPEPAQSYDVQLVNNTGSTAIVLPPNTAVELTADIDLGEFQLPTSLIRVEYDEDDTAGESGVWRTDGFDEAEAVIRIQLDGGIGNLVIE